MKKEERRKKKEERRAKDTPHYPLGRWLVWSRLTWSGLFGPFSPLHSTPLSTPLQATSVHSRPLLYQFRSQNVVPERPEPAQIIANNSVCSLSPFLLVFSCHFGFCLILCYLCPTWCQYVLPQDPREPPWASLGGQKRPRCKLHRPIVFALGSQDRSGVSKWRPPGAVMWCKCSK